MTILKTAVVVITCVITFFYYAGNVTAESFPPMQEALDAMESDGLVTIQTIEESSWDEKTNYFYAFEPNNVTPTTAFIIYPGGLLDPRSYAPAARAFAEEGYLTIIVKMPGDLAVFGITRANEIISKYPEIEKWVIGGHSIGGSMACSYAYDDPKKVDGIVLWASWPAEEDRLDDTDLKVISIYGTNDAYPDELAAAAEYLPEDTQFVVIEGGNHTQFGWYDTSPDPIQPNDNLADITREEQQEIIIQATTEFLGKISGKENCPAVAILGEENPLLKTLRQFRDEVLADNTMGRKLIEIYYNNDKRILDLLERHPAAKKVSKKVLESLIPAIELLLI